MKKIAFIGAGNMAKAIIKGLIKSELYAANEILVYNHRYEPTLQQLEAETGIQGTTTLSEATAYGEVLILMMRPRKKIPNLFCDCLKVWGKLLLYQKV